MFSGLFLRRRSAHQRAEKGLLLIIVYHALGVPLDGKDKALAG